MVYCQRIAAVFLVLILVNGCTTQPQETALPTPPPVPNIEVDTPVEPVEVVETQPEPVPPVPTRPFPVETLYSLLVAEIAGERQRYDIWLGNYIQEAHRTRDPGVTAQAARIARYLNAHQAALNTALLWLQLEPDNSEALYMATTELANSGQLMESFKYSEQLLRKGSTPIFQSIAARAGQTTDTQRETLMAEFDRLLVEYPDNSQLLLGKATLLQFGNQPEAALVLVRQVLAVQDDDLTAAILEARLLYQLGQSETALSRMLILLQRDPDNQRLRMQYARLLASIDLVKAKEQFQILVEQNPDDPDMLFSLALVASELGDEALAKSSFEQLLALGEHQDSAHFYLGRIAEGEENFRLALEHYQQVQSGPDYLPSLTQTIDIMVRLGELDGAHKRMDEIRTRFPEQAPQLYLLESQALAKYQHLDDAEALLTQGLTFNPTHADLLYSRAMINQQRELIDLMESDLRTIIRYQPNNSSALNALGYYLADKTERVQEAYDLIKQALDINPSDPAIIDSMGWVQFRLGNYEEAVLRLREALKAFPDHEIAAHLGEVLWVSGEQDEALKVWHEGLELKPNSPIITETMERLDAPPQ